MKKSLVLLLFIIFVGCEKDDVILIPTKSTIPAGYPHILTASPERVAALLPRANQFANTYQVELTGFDTLLAVAKFNLGAGINLFPDRTDTVTTAEVQESLFVFLNKWSDLFNIYSDVATLKAIERGDSSTNKFIYEKIYPELHNSYYPSGMISIKISPFGTIKDISSGCIPDNNFWGTPQVSIPKAMDRLKGKTYIFYCWVKETIVFTPDIVQKAELVRIALSRWKNDSNNLTSIEYRLCWRFQTPTFYIYVDAVTGEDLNYYEELFVC